jgi:drug/metabolite transporter (DMT)-like permease
MSAIDVVAAEPKRTRGILLVLTASVCWSLGGLFMRALHIDMWSVLAWRSLFAALALIAVVLVQHGRSTAETLRGLGRPGLMAIPISALSMYCYVASLELTTVANVMTVYATVPFVAAGVAYVWMGERPSARVMLASVVALLGIAIMAGSSTRLTDVLGNLLAFGMTLTFSIVLVVARRYPSISMAPVNAIAALICAAACFPLIRSGLPSLVELVTLAGFGFTTTALAYLLFLTGGRDIPSSEAGLLSMLDVVLGPLWVWLAFSEQPSRAALIGGGFVLAAVTWYLASEWRERSSIS